MDRITNRHLEALVSRINAITGMPQESYVPAPATSGSPSKYVAQIGCYHLSGAYGGYALHQMVNDGGGVRDIFGGHMPKRELYERMHAFIRGLETERKAA